MVTLLGVLSPGPDFFAITFVAINKKKYQALSVAIGVILGNVLWSLFAVLALNGLIVISQNSYEILRIIGGCYLLLIGFQMIRTSKATIKKNTIKKEGDNDSRLLYGLLVTLTNAKAGAFYISIFTSYIHTPHDIYFNILIIIMVFTISTLWFISLALFFSNNFIVERFMAGKNYINKVFGIILILVGLRQISWL
tara:strand:- start:532 stop:1116 length:585 start_codon:yes stop_codon:yes gene_type:complete